MPIFYHGGVYLGLVAIHDQEEDRVWTELTWSPDTKEWHRILPGTPLIPNSEVEGEYDWGCAYPAAYPVFLEDEIRLYYGASDGLHGGWRNGFLSMATLRPRRVRRVHARRSRKTGSNHDDPRLPYRRIVADHRGCRARGLCQGQRA